MNVAYFIYEGSLNSIALNCLKTLQQHCQCRILFYTDQHYNTPDIEWFPLELNKWSNRRMTHRIELAVQLPINPNDQVMVLDTDLLFQGDPFQIFKNEFDFFYTSRHYESNFKVNAGVWGFRNNKYARQLLQFMIEQANHPSWEPYQEIRYKFKRHENQQKKEKDWWTNQDLLCAIAENKPPIEVALFDAGAKFNYCPQSGGGITLNETARADWLSHIGDPNIVILHYKELEKTLCK